MIQFCWQITNKIELGICLEAWEEGIEKKYEIRNDENLSDWFDIRYKDERDVHYINQYSWYEGYFLNDKL